MKNYIIQDDWNIIEEGFRPEYNRMSESIFSIGNGHMGQRANFEEKYTGDSLQGHYIAGIYYPDKTRVGWWKHGYPEYYAKIINAPNWIGINVIINGEELDLNKVNIQRFTRTLNMQSGLLSREMLVEFPNGNRIGVSSKRFICLFNHELGVINYTLKSINFEGVITFIPYLDGDVINEDANYDEKFWKEKNKNIEQGEGFLLMETKKTRFNVCTAMSNVVFKNGKLLNERFSDAIQANFVNSEVSIHVSPGDELTLNKFASITTSLNHPVDDLTDKAMAVLTCAKEDGYSVLYEKQRIAWTAKWKSSDIQVEGDGAMQQGLRYNIFQLHQSYSGDDERLNIGPKGFTGEKYGGVTYWDTEAFCLPFFMGTVPEHVTKNLLLYRHKHLGKAIQNAEKLGFGQGAALYPMVTINGEECHNEWEITFEEIHRNGAIAYAIWNYTNYSGDKQYLAPYGFEVLLAISRFWAQRVNWSEVKQAYVILGVTGPNEYENNVNNNFHTNKMATWTLAFTLKVIDYMKSEHSLLYAEVSEKWKFNEIDETSHWKHIIENMYFPFDDDRDIYLQQDGFLDKKIEPVTSIPKESLPLNQHWSWDRILRSCYIKQADTLQNMFWFENTYSLDLIRKHFNFYEPLTVHESSLSSCVHAVLAAKIGYYEKAYEYLEQSVRLDLNDYNNDTADGLHITSMGGSWMAFVLGVAGMRVNHDRLHFQPFLPDQWKTYNFNINFRKAELKISMNSDGFLVHNMSGIPVPMKVWEKEIMLNGHEQHLFKTKEVIKHR